MRSVPELQFEKKRTFIRRIYNHQIKKKTIIVKILNYFQLIKKRWFVNSNDDNECDDDKRLFQSKRRRWKNYAEKVAFVLSIDNNRTAVISNTPNSLMNLTNNFYHSKIHTYVNDELTARMTRLHLTDHFICPRGNHDDFQIHTRRHPYARRMHVF